ncbi:MAG: hypothetical protein JJV92_01270 [Desulfosarcina sp.]|nr:hypothetical protein [Desulfobacterales bacterium]
MRELWSRHRHPELIFPNATGSLKTIQQAKTHMDRGGTQKAMKVVVAEYGFFHGNAKKIVIPDTINFTCFY